MTHLFITFVNMSLTASIAIVVVILLRQLLKKLPKIYSYLLWIVVAFRLLCPISFEIPQAPIKPINVERQVVTIPEVESSAEINNDLVIQPSEHSRSYANSSFNLENTLSYVWIIGITAMATWGIYSGINIKSQLKTSTKENGYFTHTGIDNSFIFGLFKPKIYIPSSIRGEDRALILKHEQAHLKRGDHLIKILMYIALCLHWFNPLAWVSFKLCEQDMEMSCDEKVTSNMQKEQKALYAEALLKASAKSIAAFTACFGETGAKRRIKNVLNFKKPTRFIAMISITALVITSCALAANRNDVDSLEPQIEATTSVIADEIIEPTVSEMETEVDVTIESETSLTPPLSRTLSDGTYDAFINMYDIYETERLEFITWNYFELSDNEVDNLQVGDVIDASMCGDGDRIEVTELTSATLTSENSNISRYGYDYDAILTIAEGYYLYHLKDADVWRLFEYSDNPLLMCQITTCMPLADDFQVYDQSSYVIDGGEASDICYSESSFVNTIYNNGPTQYAYNRITISDGEIVSVIIYYHP